MTTDAPTPDRTSATAFDLVAAVLMDLGNHAAAVASGDGTAHEGCRHCELTILLSRVVGFGDQLRHDRKHGDAVTP